MATRRLNGSNNINNTVSKIGSDQEDIDRIDKLTEYQTERQLEAARKVNSLRAKLEQTQQNQTLKEAEKSWKKYQKQKEKAEKQAAKDIAEYTNNLNKTAEAEKNKQAKEAAREKHQQELESLKTQASYGNSIGDKIGASIKLAGKQFADNMKNALGDVLVNGADKAVDAALGTYTKYFTSVTTRLQNSGLTFEDINDKYKDVMAFNPYFTYEDLLQNLNVLVENGIADNVTQRAFLNTISDKIATTFDAATDSLLQIVRIQQADTTAARLGLEANLTRLFNYYFNDTSYLNNVYDTVQAALIDTSASFGAQAGVEFEYIVQKWLGSLGSVGVSTGTLTDIANAINALGSGDIGYLSSNTAMQNLLMMSANRVGLPYGSLLTGGLTSEKTNQLLYGVVDYIQSIANSNNNVVRRQYADLFGVTVSDLVAFNNLQHSTIESLYSAGMTYRDTLEELDEQLEEVGSRMHISTMIENVMSNALTSIGMGITESTGLYATYKAADMLEKITGGITLPLVLGSGTTMSLEQIAKAAILGFSTVDTLIGATSALLSGEMGLLDMEEYVVSSNKGQGFTTFNNAGKLLQTTSNITTVTNPNSEGLKNSLLEQQMREAEVVTGMEQNITQDEMRKFYTDVVNYLEVISNRLSSTYDLMTSPQGVNVREVGV